MGVTTAVAGFAGSGVAVGTTALRPWKVALAAAVALWSTETDTVLGALVAAPSLRTQANAVPVAETAKTSEAVAKTAVRCRCLYVLTLMSSTRQTGYISGGRGF